MWFLQPLFTGVFVVLGIILFFQLLVKSGLNYFSLRGQRVNYSVGRLYFLSVGYFAILGFYFEYESASTQQDEAFINFRLLLLFYVLMYLGRRISLIIVASNWLARLIFWGATSGTVYYLLFGLAMFAITAIILHLIRKYELPQLVTIVIFDILVVMFWLWFHYAHWHYFGPINVTEMWFNSISFVLMNSLLHYGLTSLNNENDYLTTITRQATTDSLTKLKNYAVFSQDYQQLFGKFTGQPQPLTMIMLDVDYFKRINDRYGHLAGNKVLIQLGELFEEMTKEITGANCYRVGGEEFNILMPATDQTRAIKFAHRLQG